VTLSRLSTISRPPSQALLVRVDFKKPHPQLLLIAGSSDNSIPASLNESHHAKYKLSPSVTDFKSLQDELISSLEKKEPGRGSRLPPCMAE
jgi:hypothetical protein